MKQFGDRQDDLNLQTTVVFRADRDSIVGVVGGFAEFALDYSKQVDDISNHIGPEGVRNRKKTPIFFVDAKLSEIAQGFQKCKS